MEINNVLLLVIQGTSYLINNATFVKQNVQFVLLDNSNTKIIATKIVLKAQKFR